MKTKICIVVSSPMTLRTFYRRVNVGGNRRLAEQAAAAGVRRLAPN